MFRNLPRVLALAITAAPAPVLAQAQAADAAACEVVVWTSTGYSAGAVYDFRRDDAPGIADTDGLAAMISPDAIFAQVSESRLPAILGRRVEFSRVDKPDREMRVDRKRAGRSTSSANPCYVEVYTLAVTYQSSAVYGERLFSQFLFKDFRGPRLVKSVTFDLDGVKLKAFRQQGFSGAAHMARTAFRELFDRAAAAKLGPKPTAKRR